MQFKKLAGYADSDSILNSIKFDFGATLERRLIQTAYSMRTKFVQPFLGAQVTSNFRA